MPDVRNIFSSVPDALTLYHPDIKPEQLRTTFYLDNYYAPGTFYIQNGMGAVPSVVETMEDHLTLSNASVDSFSFAMTTHWDSFKTRWVLDSDFYSSWSVVGPSPVQGFALPQIPQEISEMFTDVSREGFELYSLSVTDGSIEGGMKRVQGMFFLNKEAERFRPEVRQLYGKNIFETPTFIQVPGSTFQKE